jgi:hypothetical protein
MANKYDPRLPLKTPLGGWPLLDEKAELVLQRVAGQLTSAANTASSGSPEARFIIFYHVLEAVSQQVRTGQVVNLSVGSLDDPLALFCMDFASLLLMIDEPSMKRLKRKLQKPNWGLPAGIDRDSVRSAPLIALTQFIDVIKETVNELADSGKSRIAAPSLMLH